MLLGAVILAYAMFGTYFVVRQKAWNTIESGLRSGLGFDSVCRDCRPTPWLLHAIFVPLGTLLTVAIWPIDWLYSLRRVRSK